MDNVLGDWDLSTSLKDKKHILAAAITQADPEPAQHLRRSTLRRQSTAASH